MFSKTAKFSVNALFCKFLNPPERKPKYKSFVYYLGFIFVVLFLRWKKPVLLAWGRKERVGSRVVPMLRDLGGGRGDDGAVNVEREGLGLSGWASQRPWWVFQMYWESSRWWWLESLVGATSSHNNVVRNHGGQNNPININCVMTAHIKCH